MNIIPMPCSVNLIEGKSIAKTLSYKFLKEQSLSAQADFEMFFEKIKKDIEITDTQQTLEIEWQKDAKMQKEAYELIIDEKITITAASDSGFFYGIQTLKQIIYQYWIKKKLDLPPIAINDKPSYKYRGYMLDVVRHFFSVADVKNILDILAVHKINKLHLHLTDDQGWRIEIKKYPLLTQVGAYRSGTLGDGVAYGGYYTQEDIAEIVNYAKQKCIEVIPEIDLPGHFTAAIASYPELSCTAQKIEVATSFGIKSDIACGGKDIVYKFFEEVIEEIIPLFNSDYIHIGGDEAPKSYWESCKDCQKKIKENNLSTTEELQGYMVNHIAAFIESKNKTAIVWNESLNSGMLRESVVCQYWSDGKMPLRVLKGINSGRKTIISKFSPYYLDYPFAMHSLKSVYTFEPELKNASNIESIWGIESPLWTEYVVDKSQVDYLTFPRLTAVAEIAWSAKIYRDYKDFELRLKEFYPLYAVYGIVPAPLKVVNPNFLQRIAQMLKFLKPMLKRESIKAMLHSSKAAKQVKSTRNK